MRGHGDREYVTTLAEHIQSRADEIRDKVSVVSTLDLVILTLLNITDELFQEKRAQTESQKELEEKAAKLLEAIDKAV